MGHRGMENNRRSIEYGTARLLAFVLPAAVLLAVYIFKGIYPFGDRSFLSTDLYHQYMPFFCEFVRAIKAGEGISYSWNIGVGSNFLALYVYYLASPLHWLGFLAPEDHIMEFITYLVVVKIGLCGLTSFLYLSGRSAEREGRALFFSCAYGLSGFLAAYNWNIMWLDCVILLPLILLGLERLVKEGKCVLYCVTLALSIFTNFYISIMICMFLVLYFIFLYGTERHPVKAAGPGWRRAADHLRPAGLFALYSLLAGGMAAVLLIPEVCAILKTDFGSVDFPERVESYFSVLDMLARHCLSVSVEKGLDHWPNIYCGTGVFLLVPLFALNEKIPLRRRFGLLAMAGFLLLGFSTNVLNFVWHGLNYPDSLPARQSFIYILLVLIMCHDACCSMDFSEGQGRQRIVRVYLGAAVFLLFVEKFVEHEDFMLGTAWLTLFFVTVYGAVLYLAYLHRERRWRVGLGIAALAAVIAETCINTYNTSVSNVDRSDYLAGLEDYRELYEQTKEWENGFYRVEKFTRKTKNDGALSGYPTASLFSSTMNSSVMDLYERWGMRHSKVYYGYDGATAFTSALLNVKYLFGEPEEYENSLYTLSGKSGEIGLYRAENTLPFGYVAPLGYDLPEGFEGSGLRLQNQMIHDLGIEERLFVKCGKEDDADNVYFMAEEPGCYYAILTASGTKKVTAVGGSPVEQSFADLKSGSVLYLGYLEEGQSMILSNGDEEDETQNVSADIYRMDEEVLREALSLLSEQHMEDVRYDSDEMTGRLSLAEAGRLILSVPDEDGWSVKLNGEEAETALFGGTFMAFDLQPGEYTLEMRYVPAGRNAGIAVSAVSVLCFLGLVCLRRKAV